MNGVLSLTCEMAASTQGVLALSPVSSSREVNSGSLRIRREGSW